MSVQAEKLRARLSSEDFDAAIIPTNPELPKSFPVLERVPLLRTILREAQYLISLLRVIRSPGIVHHFCASYLYFFLHSAPLLLLGRWSRSRIVLNYRGGKACDFLRTWGWAALPLLHMADEIVVPSEFLRQIFQKFGLASSLLPNLADTEQFPFIERERFEPRLLVTRNLEPIYDVECVLKAFQLVQEKFPEAILGIAGGGSEEEKLRTIANDLKLRNVLFFGVVPHQDLSHIYRRYDIYVNASRVDNFPGALVEAACSGLPIVTTNAGGIPEMIRHGENGVLCNVGEPQSLADGVLHLLQCQETARKLANSGRTWSEQFAWRHLLPKLLQCYGLTNENHTGALRSCGVLAP
jgi:glycosyltransferase involved in cell wall biosynthesis